MEEIYLDNSATTKPRKEVVDVMLEPLQSHYGNPSSLHRKGIEAEKLLKEARRKLANVIRAKPKEIVFTSGGTEANNLAIKGTVNTLQRYGNHLITTKIEHASVLHTFQELEEQGWEVTYLDVDETGIIDLEQLQEVISEDTILVSTMYVNNEIGVIEPVSEIARIVKQYKDSGLYLHVDGVQALGKLKMNVNNLGINLLSLSSHKVHGPKGSGALYVDRDIRLKSTLAGGEQENGYRAGTENVSGIVGFGEAAKLVTMKTTEKVTRMQKLKERLAEGITSNLAGVQINGPELTKGVPHILNFSFRDIKGEVLLHALEEENIYVSTGSACSAKSSAPSHVLQAIDIDKKAMEGALRFSLSSFTTADEIDYTIEKLTQLVPELRKITG